MATSNTRDEHVSRNYVKANQNDTSGRPSNQSDYKGRGRTDDRDNRNGSANGRSSDYKPRDNQGYRGGEGQGSRDNQGGRDYSGGRSYQNKDGQGQQRTYQNRDGQGQQRPYQSRDGQSQQRPYQSRDGQGQQRPYQSRDGQGQQRPYQSRDGQGQQRPYQSKDGQGQGQRTYQGNRDGQGNRSFTPRDRSDRNDDSRNYRQGSNRNQGYSKDYGKDGDSDGYRSKNSPPTKEHKVKEKQPEKIEIINRIEKEKKVMKKKSETSNRKGKVVNTKPTTKIKRTNNIDWTKEYENDSFDDDDTFFDY